MKKYVRLNIELRVILKKAKYKNFFAHEQPSTSSSRLVLRLRYYEPSWNYDKILTIGSILDKST